MNPIESPNHNRIRNRLRVAGLVCLAIGAIFEIVGLISFFSAFNGFGHPRFFWCCFVGMPFLFAGIVMCQFGFMGAVSRYLMAEQAPVAKDGINYMAENTQDAVKTIARSATEGIAEGLRKSDAAKH